MSAESKLFTLLTGTSAVNAVVVGRVYPMGFFVSQEEQVFPAISYMRIVSTPDNTLRGYSGINNIRMQIDCWSRSYTEARSLAALVHAAVTASTTIKGVLEDDRDVFEDETRLYRASMDFSLWDKE